MLPKIIAEKTTVAYMRIVELFIKKAIFRKQFNDELFMS